MNRLITDVFETYLYQMRKYSLKRETEGKGNGIKMRTRVDRDVKIVKNKRRGVLEGDFAKSLEICKFAEK